MKPNAPDSFELDPDSPLLRGDFAHEHLDLGALRGRGTVAEFQASFELARVPQEPGCYIMKDEGGHTIYVGKAKHLRARIRSYLNETDSRYSVKFLMRRVARIDFLVTASEKEALLLENSLIKQNRPRYNVRLKDDKTFISLRLDTRQDFPRITIVRRYKKDGAKYFGPYHDATSLRKTLRYIQRTFPLRTCTDHVMKHRDRPCLYHQLGQCVAPCVKLATREQYHEVVAQTVLALEGRSAELEKHLLEKIQALAKALAYEEAAVLRDRLFALRKTFERQRTDLGAGNDYDVFGLYQQGRYTEIQVLFYRNGKMLGARSFSFERTEMPAEELLSSMVLQYYADAPVVPAEVLLPLAVEAAEALAEILTERRGAKVGLAVPQRGAKLALVELANKNAQRSFEDKRLSEKSDRDLLEEVKKALLLPALPERIECFDISTFQGDKTVASMVVFESGQAAKARYRHFTMKTVEGQDDFASMREALLRRYTRAIEENDLPSLVLIDGGKGQLNVASAVFKDLGLDDLPHASIAKSRTLEGGGASPERFFVPGRMNPILLPQNGPVVQYLARIRDEAHRFAITHNRKRRSKATLRTSLTEIPGVGPTRARALLKHFGSVTRVREATLAELVEAPGVSAALAETIHAALHAGDGE